MLIKLDKTRTDPSLRFQYGVKTVPNPVSGLLMPTFFAGGGAATFDNAIERRRARMKEPKGALARGVYSPKAIGTLRL